MTRRNKYRVARIHKVISWGLLLLGPFIAFAQEQFTLPKASIVVDATGHIHPTGSSAGRLLLCLIYDRSDRMDVGIQDWQYDVAYRIVDENDAEVAEGTLSIYSNPANSTSKVQDLRVVNTTATMLTMTVATVTPNNAVPNSISLIGKYETLVATPLNTVVAPTLTIGTNILRWTSVPGAESYELEWIYVDRYANIAGSPFSSRKAVRLILPLTEYPLILNYPSGQVYYRVRAIAGLAGTNSVIGTVKTGAWSTEKSITVSASFERQKNWQSVTTFAEEGKRKDLITYFDGLYRKRQSLSVLNTDSSSIIQDFKYDYESRPSISILPSPVEGTNLGFRPDFHTYHGKTYASYHFKPGSVQPLDATSGASNYFSDENESVDGIHRDLVPDSEGFPIQVESYKRDQTGRLLSKSGVGKELQLRSGKETHFHYGDVESVDLARLFGSNGGDATFYKKAAKRDPNGQFTIVYHDHLDRIVATSLAGDYDETRLDTIYKVSTEELSTDLMEFNTVDVEGNRSVLSKKILSTFATEYKFEYDLTSLSYTRTVPGFSTLCATCKYNLTLQILDPNDQPVELDYLTSKVTIIKKVIEPASGTPCSDATYSEPKIEFSAHFDLIGEYTVVKKLELLEGTIEEQLNSAVATYTPERTSELETAIAAELNPHACSYTCEGYCPLGTGEGACRQACNDRMDTSIRHIMTNECNGWLEIMSNDFRPGGWIYENRSELTRIANLVSSFLDPSLVGVNSSNVYEKYRSHWPDRLLSKHPEYKMASKCPELVESRIFDFNFTKVMTYAEGAARGYLNPVSNGVDPYFNMAMYGGRVRQVGPMTLQVYEMEMHFKLQKYYQLESMGEWLNVWEFVANKSLVFGNDPLNFNEQLCEPTAINFTSDPVDPDLQWQLFKAIYLGIKAAIHEKILNEVHDIQYFDSEHAHFKRPLSFGSIEEAEIFRDNLTTDFCDDFCEARASSWLHRLKDLCGLSDVTSAAIKPYLLNYCSSHCTAGDLLAPITADAIITDALLVDVQTILGDRCSLRSLSATTETNFTKVCKDAKRPDAWTQLVFDAIKDKIKAGKGAFESFSNKVGTDDFSVFEICREQRDPKKPNDKDFPCSNCKIAIYDKNGDLVRLDARVTMSRVFADESPPAPSLSGLSYSGLAAWVSMPAKKKVNNIFKVYFYSNCKFGWEDDCQYFPACVKLDEFATPEDRCQDQVEAAITYEASVITDQEATEFTDIQIDIYENKCLGPDLKETFIAKYTRQEYQYTLFYYDAAGNQVQSVPPRGVHPAADGEPVHTLTTISKYNSRDLATERSTPDGGTMKFWYNLAGLLRFSQDTHQKPDKYSFTKYDAQRRVIAVGEVTLEALSDADIENPDFPLEGNPTVLDVVKTFYDAPATPHCDALTDAHNLRGRVSASLSVQNGAVVCATCYSYDPQGNVKALVQDITGLGAKRIDYIYDVISRNLKQVIYQKDQPDQFFQRNEYDADNRISKVFTSRDGIIWDNDARYFYYRHGPLARMELGQDHVQGLDYVYTIQGWLKAVNSNTLDPSRDPGGDGLAGFPHASTAKDAFGFTLGYFSEDYKPISAAAPAFEAEDTGSAFKADGVDLHNGNITRMVKAIDGLSIHGESYKYDQLYRLKKSAVNSSIDVTRNRWRSGSAMQDFQTTYEYDRNGNIINLTRSATGLNRVMDNLDYTYSPSEDRVLHVKDHVPDDHHTDDFESPNVFDPANPANNLFAYDARGRLIRDNSSRITNLEWNAFDRLSKVRKENDQGDHLEFRYNGTQHRIAKVLKLQGSEADATTWDTHYYVRDVIGDVMATYRVANSQTSLLDFEIKGIKRVGLWHINQALSAVPPTPNLTRGNKEYELRDHLSNVMLTISDRQTGIDPDHDGLVDFYLTDQISKSYYQPYGYRILSFGEYRYGMNGQEKVNEIGDEGTHYTSLYWEYDSRIARRWNVDPQVDPSQSSYAVFRNDPVLHIDEQGASPEISEPDESKNQVLSPPPGILYKDDASYHDERYVKGPVGEPILLPQFEPKGPVLSRDDGRGIAIDNLDPDDIRPQFGVLSINEAKRAIATGQNIKNSGLFALLTIGKSTEPGSAHSSIPGQETWSELDVASDAAVIANVLVGGITFIASGGKSAGTTGKGGFKPPADRKSGSDSAIKSMNEDAIEILD